MEKRINPGTVGGRVRIPASKSLCHRAVMADMLSGGDGQVKGIYLSEDITATLEAMQVLLKAARKTQEESPEASEPVIVDCHESGSTLRFLVPLASALGVKATFTGHGRLPERPMGPYYEIFDRQELSYETSDGKLPLIIRGRLTSGEFEIDGGISSQFVTGLLMALPLLDGDSVVRVRGKLESRPYVDMTIDVMDKYDVKVKEPEENVFEIKGGQAYQPCDYEVEGDWSQAAFMITAAGCAGREEGLLLEGLHQETKQGDAAILTAFEALGGEYRWEKEGLRVFRSKLKGDLTWSAQDTPDIVPILSVMGVFNHGTLTITNAARLRLKESDRLLAVWTELSKAGAGITMQEDGLMIHGTGSINGGKVKAWNDHRMAMSLAVLGLGSKDGVTIEEAESVKKSWPDFFETLGGL